MLNGKDVLASNVFRGKRGEVLIKQKASNKCQFDPFQFIHRVQDKDAQLVKRIIVAVMTPSKSCFGGQSLQTQQINYKNGLDMGKVCEEI